MSRPLAEHKKDKRPKRRDNVAASPGGDSAGADLDLDDILAWADEPVAPPAAEEAPATTAGDDGGASGANSANGAVIVAPSPMANGDALFAAATYDPALEEKEYSRALMSPADLAKLKEDIAEQGFMTIEMVRELVRQNTVKESQEARGETYAIDPEMMMLIDTRTNFRVFITGDNVYTREELFAHYPFEEFCTTPEEVFVQQEVGVFPPKKWAMSEGDPSQDSGGHEFVARDVGDNEEFIMIEDLVGRAARKNYKMKRAPVRIVKTKVFLGKDRWEDFATMKRFVRSFQTFVTPLMIASREGDASSARALTYLFGGRAGGPLAIQDEAGLALERERQAQERERRALEALEAKARALRAKEEELRVREEELYRSLGLDPPPRPARSFESYVAEAKTGGGAANRDDEDPPDSEGADDAVPL